MSTNLVPVNSLRVGAKFHLNLETTTLKGSVLYKAEHSVAVNIERMFYEMDWREIMGSDGKTVVKYEGTGQLMLVKRGSHTENWWSEALVEPIDDLMEGL